MPSFKSIGLPVRSSMAVIALPSKPRAFRSTVTVTSVGSGSRLVTATTKLLPGVLYNDTKAFGVVVFTGQLSSQ